MLYVVYITYNIYLFHSLYNNIAITTDILQHKDIIQSKKKNGGEGGLFLTKQGELLGQNNGYFGPIYIDGKIQTN